MVDPDSVTRWKTTQASISTRLRTPFARLHRSEMHKLDRIRLSMAEADNPWPTEDAQLWTQCCQILEDPANREKLAALWKNDRNATFVLKVIATAEKYSYAQAQHDVEHHVDFSPEHDFLVKRVENDSWTSSYSAGYLASYDDTGSKRGYEIHYGDNKSLSISVHGHQYGKSSYYAQKEGYIEYRGDSWSQWFGVVVDSGSVMVKGGSVMSRHGS
ncbi:hypothetical protein TREMEDRAFT_62617 [Tremella mesenterica DSM 1558]|uniref:uncharacterized protein n=1 Tax=Tremella mesenterica (strain ATCC 24925 / CBS 8224 / DSM 1558 / NBRC 9311 / NRRL Y-6157 / RJB 2259-6 / UBC 559-6) TaxID=578456 RepID=UPI0003F48CD2|nr:uncharacterized protein TREMEDRAFT_62617 [Tremella mesenterica DSM 1558]EIW68900.1 hypothetical protein TREMEDRAFT_62617 [Tremella mesenterica DSM 1558]